MRVFGEPGKRAEKIFYKLYGNEQNFSDLFFFLIRSLKEIA